jgi:hypothetical protein
MLAYAAAAKGMPVLHGVSLNRGRKPATGRYSISSVRFGSEARATTRFMLRRMLNPGILNPGIA